MTAEKFLKHAEKGKYVKALECLFSSCDNELFCKYAVDEAVIILKETYSSWRLANNNLESAINNYRIDPDNNYYELRAKILDCKRERTSFSTLEMLILKIELNKNLNSVVAFVLDFLLMFRGKSGVGDKKMKEYLIRLASLIYTHKPLLGAIYG